MYWDGFWVLSRSRGYAVGFGGGVALGLKYSEIAAYAKDHQLDVDETVDLLGQMDVVYLQHVNREK